MKHFHGKRLTFCSDGVPFLAIVQRANWLPLSGPSELLLPSRSPEFAAFFEVVPLVQLFPADVARHKGVAVLVNAIGEVLAGHADHAAFPAPQFSFLDVLPFLHATSREVWMY